MTLSCKERVTGNWLQRTEALSNLKDEESFQAAEGRTRVLVLRDPGRGTNPPAHPRRSTAPCGSVLGLVALLGTTWHQTCQRKPQLELPLRVLSCWLRRMSNVCVTCSPQASGEEDRSLSSFWSSCLMAPAAFLGQSYSSRSLVCWQPDKRPSPLHLPDLLPKCELGGEAAGIC